VSFAPSFAVDPYVFYSGTKSSVTSVPFTVSLDGRIFAIDFNNYRRSSLASLRDSVISTGQVDDALFNTDGAWWRYKYDWTYGAGQEVLDLGGDRDPRRFETSVGIDPWDESGLRLHKATSLSTSTVSGSSIYLTPTGSHLFAADTSVLYRSANLTAWTQITGLSSLTIRGLSTDGKDLYVATSTQLFKVASGATAATSLVNKAHNGVWFVGNYLLASQTNKLVSVSSTGVDSVIFTHYQPDFEWKTCFAIGSKIYAAGNAGNRAEVYGFIVNSSGTLIPGAEVVQLSIGETINSIISHVGNVIFCTNKGIRLGTVSQDGTLTYGPLIDVPGSVESAQAEGRYVWFNWRNIGANKTGAGRLDLSSFVRTLQPAFASDLYVDSSNPCTAVARFADRLVLGVPNAGIYVEHTTNYVATGELSSGTVFFGTVESKIVNDLKANFASLNTNQSVKVLVYDDQNTLLESVAASTPNIKELELQLDGESADSYIVKVELTGPTTTTPIFKRWRLRAFPIVPPVEQFIVPLLLHSKVVVNDAQGQLHSSDVVEEMAFIEEMWRKKTPLSFVEGTQVFRVRIEGYEFQPREWADTHVGFEGTMVVRLVTI
jgi:hypothetical protein